MALTAEHREQGFEQVTVSDRKNRCCILGAHSDLPSSRLKHSLLGWVVHSLLVLLWDHIQPFQMARSPHDLGLVLHSYHIRHDHNPLFHRGSLLRLLFHGYSSLEKVLSALHMGR